jgi:hypothetical protein
VILAPRFRPRIALWLFAATAVVILAAATGAYIASRQPVPVATMLAPPPLSPPSPSSLPSLSATPSPALTYAANGPGTFVYAGGQSPVVGGAGTLRPYRVGIETGTPVPVAAFAAAVEKTLGDPRSWISGNNVRFQRVAGGAAGVNFTVLLVTPGTAQKLCLADGLDIVWHGEPYTSCQVGSQAIINISRYLTAVPDYGAPVQAYDQYAINHEVGHVLGYGHELCPAKGQPAPVMQQQTFDLQGCVANSWPYLNGKRYSGPPGRIVPSD